MSEKCVRIDDDVDDNNDYYDDDDDESNRLFRLYFYSVLYNFHLLKLIIILFSY